MMQVDTEHNKSACSTRTSVLKGEPEVNVLNKNLIICLVHERRPKVPAAEQLRGSSNDHRRG